MDWWTVVLFGRIFLGISMMTPGRDPSKPRREEAAEPFTEPFTEPLSSDRPGGSRRTDGNRGQALQVFKEIRRFPEIDSTNSYLVVEARRGAPEGMVVVADHQRMGRGRIERSWVAPRGSSLLLSVLMRPSFGAELVHLCSMVVGLAALDACRLVAGVEAKLKWPNDLLVADRKVAGVLAEAVFADGPAGGMADGFAGGMAVVVGLGLNVNWRGHEGLMVSLDGAATALDREVGHAIDREQLLHCFLESLEDRYGALSSRGGRRSQAREYRTSCGTIGARVRVDINGEQLVGAAVDVTLEGHLLVDTGTCTKTVVAGDVAHLRPLER